MLAMGNIEVTARIEREGTLFRLNILSWTSTDGLPKGHLQRVEKKFFSVEEAQSWALNEYGVAANQIRVVSTRDI